ncbi:sensor histidine kinase [Streptomyces sp. NPDC093252]|uniref:sensor histidine kinase n=1 Tax=Streptomyces sp. NPDC093252 TaxID=3154980 RepID=UPI0034391491
MTRTDRQDEGADGETGASGECDAPGPPASGYSLLPWLLLGLGAFATLFQGRTGSPWIGGLGLLTFNSLYIYVVFRSFVPEARRAAPTRVALALMTVLTCALAAGYGGYWLLFFPLLGLAVGAAARGPRLGRTALGVTLLAGVTAWYRENWGGLDIAYATFMSTMVTAALLSLSEAVRDLRAAREELARRAVERERLRFSRDLHDLLGHTLSVIVVKSEAARRLAPRDLDAALGQIGDIESVGRQALTEIREAVTGYREGGLAEELDRARSALTAAGVRPEVRRAGPPLPARAEILFGWVVREAVTNVIRHSGARHCEIVLTGAGGEAGGRARLRVADDGRGPVPGASSGHAGDSDPTRTGTGLRGLTERLAAAGGSLTAGPGAAGERGRGGGWVVTVELPLTENGPPPAGARAEPPVTGPAVLRLARERDAP